MGLDVIVVSILFLISSLSLVYIACKKHLKKLLIISAYTIVVIIISVCFNSIAMYGLLGILGLYPAYLRFKNK